VVKEVLRKRLKYEELMIADDNGCKNKMTIALSMINMGNKTLNPSSNGPMHIMQ
jgi:hypothetical protein